MPRIVVIEDEEDILDNIVLLLELRDVGYEMYGASNPSEGLALIEEKRPDVVLADIMLPGMDGFTLVEHVRAMPNMERVAFVFMSAYVDEASKQRASKLGAVGYLTKPFKDRELYSVIERVLMQ